MEMRTGNSLCYFGVTHSSGLNLISYMKSSASQVTVFLASALLTVSQL